MEEPVQSFPLSAIPQTPPPPSIVPKLLVALCLVIIFLLLCIIYILYSHNQKTDRSINSVVPETVISPIPTISNWKTHITSTYEIGYPAGVSLVTDPGSTAKVFQWGPTQKEGTELHDGFLVSFQPREIPETTLKNYVRNKITEIERQEGIVELISGPDPIIINGYSGFTYTQKGLGEFKIIVLESPDKILFMEISILVSDPGHLGFQEIVDHILSTFKFSN
jgi:hypothetical protein